jgi:hypothetical protein
MPSTDTKISNAKMQDVRSSVNKFASPSRALLKLWREWIALHTVLDKGMPGEISAPFFSASSSESCPKRILAVGKATRGDWYSAEYKRRLRQSPNEAIWNRLDRNRELVEKGNRSPFLRHLQQLDELIPAQKRCSIIWSNFAKIGSLNGNPSGILLSAQQDLAKRTLAAEIKEYQPALVVFTTGSYGGDFLSQFGKWKQYKKGGRLGDEVWWTEGAPAMLATGHPQGASRDETRLWIDEARRLIRRNV